jgi:3-hydroxyisobutyrate dehydrogenase-like beta-hydroxyacid dehydrogenase
MTACCRNPAGETGDLHERRRGAGGPFTRKELAMTVTSEIGWVGLGAMGSRMAPNLVKNGYSVTGFDVDGSRVAAAAAQGLAQAPSLAALVANSDVVVSMIPHDEALLDVVRNLCESAKRTACLIDMSTVSPDVSAEAAIRLAAAGIAYLRAPVSGSTALAESGALSILISGPETVFETWRPLFGALGKKITYLGPNEEARIMKLVVNVIVASINTALAEALNLGRRSGLDWSAMLDVISESAAASPYIASKVAKLKERDWSPAATVEVIAKDMDLALELAKKRGAFVPTTALTRQVLAAVEGKGQGKLDMSSIATFFN